MPMKAKTKARTRTNASYSRLTESDKSLIRERIDAGETRQSIADEFGITKAQVKYLAGSQSVGRRGRRRVDHRAIKAESDAMRISALEAEIVRLKGGSRLPVVCSDPPAPAPREVWLKHEEECEQSIRHVIDRKQFEIDFNEIDSHRPIAITFVSDQHIAPGAPVAMRQMRLDAELIASTPGVYAILGGDGIDNHIKHHGAIIAARSQPSDQWKDFEYYLSILAPKIIAVSGGNLDHWSNQIGGTDVLSMVCRQQNVCYSPHEIRLTAIVGSQQYKVAFKHQFRMNSSFNQTHAVKQWYRIGDEDFDVGGIAHHHEVAIETFMARGLPRIALRPGAYQITSAHSEQYGFNPSVPMCPTVVLDSKTRDLIPFYNIRHAVACLPSLRAA